MDQPIRTDPSTAPIATFYLDGKLDHTSTYRWAPKGKVRIMLADMMATFDAGNGWLFSRQKDKLFDLFIAGEPLNALVGLLLRRKGKVKKLAYIPADVSDHGLLHDFVKGRADYILPLTVSLCPPVKSENFIPRNDHAIGYLGALEERFGVDKLIQAVPLIQKAVPHVRVEIVGSGPQREELEQKADGLPVRFHGFLPDEEAERVMRGIAVGAAPYTEAFPNLDSGKIRFYAWCGVPSVISKQTPEMVDLVMKYAAGVPADPTPEEIAKAIVWLLTNDEAYQFALDGCMVLADAFQSTVYFDKLFQSLNPA